MIILESQSERFYPSLSYDPPPMLVTDILGTIPLEDVSKFVARFDIVSNDVSLNMVISLEDGGGVLAALDKTFDGIGKIEVGLAHRPLTATTTATVNITAGQIRMAWEVIVFLADDDVEDWLML